ncbi:MAG TPA: GDP-mannose 4,6-dehydratase [Candidatus Dormibacteraeota bacterium]|nr:GDP-mannose 4,6-dehydratase [Candidatus Dormibacteraeota bacterium]
MRYLITGGAGFIGSHLADFLLSRGHQVIVLDDLSTGSIENIRHLKSNPRMSYFLEPIENRHVLAELVDEADAIFHLAAAVGVRLIIESPVRTIETNVNGTQLVLEVANKKRKLVFCASTSEVYGKNGKLPFTEDSDLVLGATTKSRWSYAASKAVEEFLAVSYWKERRQPVVIGRLFNTVGPRQTGRYGMVLPTFAKQALEGRPLTVYGNGQQSRCFSYVRDVVEAIYRLMSNDRAVGEVVNIGSQQEITIEGLAELVKERTGCQSPIVHVPYDEAYEPGFEDMVRRVPSLEKLERLAGFVPQTPVSEIVDRVIAHLDDRRQRSVAEVSAALEA